MSFAADGNDLHIDLVVTSRSNAKLKSLESDKRRLGGVFIS